MQKTNGVFISNGYWRHHLWAKTLLLFIVYRVPNTMLYSSLDTAKV